MDIIEHIQRSPKQRRYETPLLFLHGAWHQARSWALWLDYFADLGYETHAISLPGHGTSSLHKRHLNCYSFQDYVDALATEIASISPRPVVMGHSLGGAVVQAYLADHQLPAAVLLATLPSRGIAPMILRLLGKKPLPLGLGLLTLNLYRWVGTPELAQFLFLNRDTRVNVEQFQATLCGESMRVALRLQLPFARVNREGTPVLVVAGENDAMFTIEEQQATARKYGAPCLVIENQPHNLMMESAWRQVADQVHGWLTSLAHP